MSLKKIAALLIIAPLAVVLIAFIIANRSLVPLNLSIFAALFGQTEGGYSFTAPLFFWLFLFLALGAALGSLAMLPRHCRVQKEISALERDNARLATELARRAPQSQADDSAQF